MPALTSPSIPPDPTCDPSTLSSDERRREIAALLARGVLRLRECQPVAAIPHPPRTPEKTSNPLSIPLDVHAGTRLHVVKRTTCRQAVDARKELHP